MVQINYDQLATNLQRYIQTPEFDELSKEVENSVLFNIIGCALAAVIGFLVMCTIVFIKPGFGLFRLSIGAFLTGEAFQNNQTFFQRDPGRAVPLVAAVVVVGRRYGMVIGSFSKATRSDAAFLAMKATEFADAYAKAKECDDNVGNKDEELFAILRDDTFVHRRRRRVPSSYADERDLVVFDIELNKTDVVYADGVGWILCVAVPDRVGVSDYRGQSIQIPWSVGADAVSFAE